MSDGIVALGNFSGLHRFKSGDGRRGDGDDGFVEVSAKINLVSECLHGLELSSELLPKIQPALADGFAVGVLDLAGEVDVA